MTKSNLISGLLIGVIVAWVFNRFVVRPFMPWWVGLVSTVVLVAVTLVAIKIVSSTSSEDT
jgi:multisubunit Na+/H+ antiporter MnhE subunit